MSGLRLGRDAKGINPRHQHSSGVRDSKSLGELESFSGGIQVVGRLSEVNRDHPVTGPSLQTPTTRTGSQKVLLR